jgi:hypothetical protein
MLPLQDMQGALPAARDQIQLYTTTCGYNEQFDDWATKIAANASYSACPPVDTRCVKGSYRTAVDGGCRSCFGDGTQVGRHLGGLTCTLRLPQPMPRA